MGPGFRRVKRAVFVSTGGKTKEQIARDVANAMLKAGLLSCSDVDCKRESCDGPVRRK
jgi:hypothetical protein